MVSLWVWKSVESLERRFSREGGVWGSLAWGWDWGEIRDADLFSRHLPLGGEVAPLRAGLDGERFSRAFLSVTNRLSALLQHSLKLVSEPESKGLLYACQV